MKHLHHVLFCAVLLITLAACQSASPSPGAASRLRMGLLPILDVLPMYVAEQEGYFKEQKLDVELTLFPSALERDSAFQAGQIDGELNDLISAALLNKDGEHAKMVRIAYLPSAKLAQVSLLAAPGSKIQTVADLKGVPVAISGNTIMDYAADQMLRSAGLASSEIQTMEVTKIPVRVEMLIKGQVQAAALPEPMTSLALQQGARLIAGDQKVAGCGSVITFRRDVVDKNADAVRRFLVAYEKGVQALTDKPEAYRDLMVEKAKVPDSLRDTLPMPSYPRAGLPSKEAVATVVDWMTGRGLLTQPLAYDRMVNGQLLPK